VTGRAKRNVGIALSLLTLGATGFMVWRMIVSRQRAVHVQRAADEWTNYRTCLLGKDADTDAPKSALLAREVAMNAPDPTWPGRCRAHLVEMGKALAQLPDKDPRLLKLRGAIDAAIDAPVVTSPALDDLWHVAKVLPSRGPEAPGAPPPKVEPGPPAGAAVALVARPAAIDLGDLPETVPQPTSEVRLLGQHAACWLSIDRATVTRCADVTKLGLGRAKAPWIAAAEAAGRFLIFDDKQPGSLIDVATGKAVLDGALTSVSVLADGTVAAVRRLGDGPAEELVRIGAGGATDRTALPARRGYAGLVADELVWTDTRGHLVTRHVTPAGTPPGPVVDHGEGVRSLYRGCRTAHGLAVTAEHDELRGHVMHTDVRVVFRDGDAWSAPVTGETSWTPYLAEQLDDYPPAMDLIARYFQLTCEDDAAVLTSIVDGRVQELRCTRAGCTLARSEPLPLAPPTETHEIGVTHVGHDAVVARIARLPGVVSAGGAKTLRIRRGPVAKLAAAPETVIATDSIHGGWLTPGDLRVLSDGRRALILIQDGASTRAITIDGTGHATPVTAPADPPTAPR